MTAHATTLHARAKRLPSAVWRVHGRAVRQVVIAWYIAAAEWRSRGADLFRRRHA